MIIEQTTDSAGKVRVLWQQPSGVTYYFKFNTEPTTQEIQVLADEKESNEQYINEDSLGIAVDKVIIRQFVETIKDRPNITLTQFNTAINNLPWYVQAQLKCLIYELGVKLGERKEVDISNVTETQFFNAVRNFIANTPIKRLAKILLNELNY